MEEEIQLALDEAKEAMTAAIKSLEGGLLKIRAGKATPAMLDSVKVEYYGSLTPLSQVANINTLDSRTLTIQPWEKDMLDEIAKGITIANLGLNPQNNGESILINVPALTEETRRDLVKRAKAEGENAKVSIRNARKDANDFIKNIDGISEDFLRDGEASVQDLTNTFTNKIDSLIEAKEKDIMTV